MAKTNYFKCKNTRYFGNCERCVILDGECYYSKVVNFVPEYKRSRCGICINKNTDKCKKCDENKYALENYNRMYLNK